MNKKLENKFEDSVKEMSQKYKDMKKEIAVHIKNARAEIQKAEKISEKYGLPFYAEVSHISQNYRPKSFDKKWGSIMKNHPDKDADDYEELEVWDDLLDCGLPEEVGWEHSAVCW